MKAFQTLIVGLGAACLLFAPYAAAQEKSRLEEVRERGRLIVGTSSEAPPFGSSTRRESWSDSTSIARN